MSIHKRSSHLPKILYAICQVDVDPLRFGASQGLEGAQVYCVEDNGLFAVVSDVATGKVRPDRRSLTAYQAVLHDLVEKTTVLPLRFGTISKNQICVQNLLARNRKAILDQLKKVNGCVEMGLRVSWDVANIYDFFIGTHAALRDARDELVNDETAGRDERIQLGRLYESFLNADRRDHTDRVKNLLVEYCEDIVVGELKREKDVMNLACLVRRTRMDEFVKGVFEVSKLFDNDYLFDYSGPWAPHNFARIDLKVASPANDVA